MGVDGQYGSIGAAIAAADPGDTIRVAPGVYREQLAIDRALTLIGEDWPVIDGGREGHVIEATAPVTVEGFAIRGSGTSVDVEHAGIMVREATARVANNRIEDVLYGVYLKQAPNSTILNNTIRGKLLPPPRRGDGIRLWHSSGTEIAENEVNRMRDVVVYFSDDLLIRDNTITEGRYGLHYMYSDRNRIEGNLLIGNDVGAFIMYSSDVELIDNEFTEGHGSMGMGLGLKDADEIRVESNLFVDNAVGVHLDNSPHSVNVTNTFSDNVLANNDTAIRLLPSVTGNQFRANAFVGNERPAEVSGGVRAGQVEQNDWAGNYWDRYAGFDRDGNGVGDSPYIHARFADELLARHPGLRFFARSPAVGALDAAARFFPMLRPEPVVYDPHPNLEPPTIHDPEAASKVPVRARNATAWALLALACIAPLWLGGRRTRRIFDRNH